MRYLLVFSSLLYLAFSQNPVPSRGESRKQQRKESTTTQQPANKDQCGTEETPLVVKTIPTAKTQAETEQEAEDRKEKSANDRNLVVGTYILGAIGALQLLVFGYQATQLRKTVEAASGQSQAMERSITEANRLASAMEGIAEDIESSSNAATASVAALRERTAQQMRAYLTVNIGFAVFQERNKGLRFEGKPLLINTGHTPAKEVSFRASAAILQGPLPDDFAFPLSAEIKSTATLGAGQNANLSAVVDDFVDDAAVEDIKIGKDGRCLFVWGVVTYEDIFAESHFTKFCQTLVWQTDGKVYGFYYPRHNEAT